MPFELGLAVALTKIVDRSHHWIVLEEVPHRLTKSLSDLNGTDPLIHHGNSDGILRVLSNALYRNSGSPSFSELQTIHHDLRKAESNFRAESRVGNAFEARTFKSLVLAAQSSAHKVVGA